MRKAVVRWLVAVQVRLMSTHATRARRAARNDWPTGHGAVRTSRHHDV